MASNQNKVSYVTDLPKAPAIENWQKRFNFVLIKSLDQFKQVFEEWKKVGRPITAFDTETTHLSIIDLKLVGFSFCFDRKTAYYIPVGHLVGDNLPLHESLAILFEMVSTAKLAMFYNAPFDLRVLRKYEFDSFAVRLLDVMALVWNMDTNIKMPSLKESALFYLGFKMTTFKELLNSNSSDFFQLTSCDEETGENIAFLSPEQVTDYASADALCTFFLFIRHEIFYNNNSFIVNMDSEFERVIMHLEETPVNFNLSLLDSLEAEGRKRISEIEGIIKEILGADVEVTSNPQLGEALKRKKLPVTINKETENYILNEAALINMKLKHANLKVNEKYTFGDLINYILEFRGAKKENTTYLSNFKNHSFKEDGKAFGFFQYLTHRNKTGRLQGSGGKPKKGNSRVFMGLNVQNITKPKPAHFKPVKSEKGILGWGFEQIDKEIEGVTVEGFAPKNLREILIPYPDHYILSVDYSGQEIVVAANLSKDRAFLDPLKAGEDPHTEVAIKMFGKENYDKGKRKIAKFANFGCLYLGTEYALKQSLPNKTLQELKEYVKKWREIHKDYFSYLNKNFALARRQGYIKTAFGRHRRVAYYFNSSDYKTVQDGKKAVANSPVQGVGGDIIRYCLIRIFQEVLLNPKYEGKVYFMSTVHDEINWSITKDPKYFYEISQKILDIMVDLPFNWEVPLTVSTSLGRNWGEQFPFVIKDGVWIPNVS